MTGLLAERVRRPGLANVEVIQAGLLSCEHREYHRLAYGAYLCVRRA